jgi:hypothetical protein
MKYLTSMNIGLFVVFLEVSFGFCMEKPNFAIICWFCIKPEWALEVFNSSSRENTESIKTNHHHRNKRKGIQKKSKISSFLSISPFRRQHKRNSIIKYNSSAKKHVN